MLDLSNSQVRSQTTHEAPMLPLSAGLLQVEKVSEDSGNVRRQDLSKPSDPGLLSCSRNATLCTCQARSQEAEAQLSKATTELVELRTRQAELEAKNQLLENLTNVKRPGDSQVPVHVIMVTATSTQTNFKLLTPV